MAPKYKLIYFPLTGLGESIRLLFIAAGVEFEDCRVPYEEWPNVKPGTSLLTCIIISAYHFISVSSIPSF